MMHMPPTIAANSAPQETLLRGWRRGNQRPTYATYAAYSLPNSRARRGSS